MSDPVGAFVSKSRAMTASNCSSVSNTVKSSSGKKLEGKTSRPRRLITNGFITHILPVPGAQVLRCGKVVVGRESKTPATQDFRELLYPRAPTAGFSGQLCRAALACPDVQLVPPQPCHGRAGELLGRCPADPLVPSGVSHVRHPLRPGRRLRQRAAREGHAALSQAALCPGDDADPRPAGRGARGAERRDAVLQPDPLRARCAAEGPEGAARRAAVRAPRIAAPR